ncbi:uncharacterized protein LOC120153963 isoform X2 [Hibiscus syriacus]|uniref:uncharacterized protein LOC120153963 isoform X1 n=1 Tax=Hibiscus syriacus TaxID=106335 RepID=UPI001922CA7B|nr:uncharacterized protein LOC120153963 isoform X1 [Hibiscus syriacus]XP_039021762.1 uncharacterized protein LOC120153963 isoform X2 [Hibiscus syriacus]
MCVHSVIVQRERLIKKKKKSRERLYEIPEMGCETKQQNKRMGKRQSSSQRNPPKPKVAKRKYRGSRKMKILEKEPEKELEALEAKAWEMRRKVKQMKLEYRKSKAKLRKLERTTAEIREAHHQASISNAQDQLLLQAMLPLFLD